MKQSKQIVNSNFTTVVLELEQAIKEGYSVVTNEVARPYHAILGNFYITVEKEVDEEVCNPVYESIGSPDGASAMKPAVKQQNTRKSK
jgi:hypothetical protein